MNSSLSREESLAAFQHAVAYDELRLRVYRDVIPVASRISIRHSDFMVLMRFDDVGYFNAVYSETDIIDKLGEIEDFFRASPFGCRLIQPGLTKHSLQTQVLLNRGWKLDAEFAWLSAAPIPNFQASSNRFVVRPADSRNAALFFQIYLESFDVEQERIPNAVENMRHLFAIPSLHFVFVFQDELPVGIGIWRHVDGDAYLCAGGMLTSHRNQGGHHQLLAERMRHAVDLGCRRGFAWTTTGNKSHSNMERVGFRTVDISVTLRLPAERLA